MVDHPQWVTVVGSRETPDFYYQLLVQFTEQCVSLGIGIRTGDARQGGDKAARYGARNGCRAIYTPVERNLPYHVAGPSLAAWDDARVIARGIHPIFDRLSPFVQALHARNTFQVLGDTLDDPSAFMIFYAPIIDENRVKGGTNTAYQVARDWGIPTYNVIDRHQVLALQAHLKTIASQV